MSNKFKTKSNEMLLLDNDNLMCKKCIYKTQKTSNCLQYEDVYKPLKVLDGGKCDKFKEVT